MHSEFDAGIHRLGERGSFASAVWHRERPELASGVALPPERKSLLQGRSRLRERRRW